MIFICNTCDTCQAIYTNFHINYILHYYYYYLMKYVKSTLVLCLAHHLMCWVDTSEDSFKPIEIVLSGSFDSLRKTSLDFFKYEERSLWIFFFMLCAWHTLMSLAIKKSLVIICVSTYLFIYFIYSWRHHINIVDY